MASRCTLFRPGLTPYDDACRLQDRLAAQARAGGDESLVLLEHLPTYTLGARGDGRHLLLTEEAYRARGVVVQRANRGGGVTFHGPGQIVGYPILRLREHGPGPVWYVRTLEAMLIDVLSRFGITAGRDERNAGVWVGDAKIAAIGVRVSRGITTHGFALNVNTDLSYFANIVPCGLAGVSMTSMQGLTSGAWRLDDVEDAIAVAFATTFDLDLAEGGASARAMLLEALTA